MSEARLLFLQGYADQPLAAAELGYRDAAAFPDLAWSFRILLAEAQVRKGQAGSAVQLLAEEPGIALPREVLWRRWLSRSYALCSASRYQEADGSFATAEHVQLPDPALEAEFYLVKGRCDLIKREWATAAFWFNKAENSAQATQFTKMYARMGLGRAAMQSLNYEESERWYRRALEIEPGLAALPAQEATLGNLGFAYFELGEFSKALEHSRAAEELAGKIGLVQDRMSWLLDVGRAYDATGQYGFAQEYYNKALAIARQLGDQKIRAKALHNLVQIDLFHGKLASAEEHQSEARNLNTEGDDLLQFNRDEAGIAAAKSDWTRAEHLLLEVLPELKNSPRLTWMVQADLARVCVAQKKVQAADQWFQRGIATMENAAASMRRTEF
ncbi:MAG TPA: tetratricopeptide repeat protein, partial [Terriglobales bacterium]|nr:tetratricopeptide repeat protein [Terriglobales bacterium]